LSSDAVQDWIAGVGAKTAYIERGSPWEIEAVVKEEKEKALAEHVACHPEDVGLTVQDFTWIVQEIVRWPA